MQEAWDALEHGRQEEALRRGRRALEAGFVNPRLWLEHGLLLERCGHPGEAVRTLQRALQLAPGLQEAREALLRLQGDVPAAAVTLARVPPPPAVPPTYTERTSRYDWSQVTGELRTRGWSVLADLLRPAELPGPDGSVLAMLRDETYGRTVDLANDWQELLDRTHRFPLRYEDLAGAGDQGLADSVTVRDLPREDSGSLRPAAVHLGVRYPLALWVPLSDPVVFLLADQRPGKVRLRCREPLRPGDGVLFCAAERLVQVGGAVGLQPVLVGLDGLTEALRLLEISF